MYMGWIGWMCVVVIITAHVCVHVQMCIYSVDMQSKCIVPDIWLKYGHWFFLFFFGGGVWLN